MVGKWGKTIFLALLVGVATSIYYAPHAFAGASQNASGFAWGGGATTNGAGYDGTGWFSFNNLSDGSATDYGVNIPTTGNGNLSGYAWSENYGWLSFNNADLTGCVPALSQAKRTGNAITGGARILGIKDAVSAGNAGGFDGCISLSGASPAYGVSISGASLAGYGWSSDLGWISFTGVTNGPVSCSNSANNPPTCDQCPDGLAYQSQSCVACGGNPAPTGCTGAGGGAGNPLGSLVCINGATNPTNCNSFPPAQPVITSFYASPATIDEGQSSTLFWDSNNASSCTGTGFLAGGPSGNRSVLGPSSTPPDSTSGIKSYQLICSGLGGDSSPRFESVTVLSPIAFISANPLRVHTGAPSTITWSASQVTSCAISGPGLSRTDYAATPTSKAVTISSQSVFTITCQTNGGQTITRAAVVNVIPSFREF